MSGEPPPADPNQPKPSGEEEIPLLQKVLNDKERLFDNVELPPVPEPTWRIGLFVIVYILYVIIVGAVGVVLLFNSHLETIDDTGRRNLTQLILEHLDCIYNDNVNWICGKEEISRTVNPILQYDDRQCTAENRQTMQFIDHVKVGTFNWSDWSPCMADSNQYSFKLLPIDGYMVNSFKLAQGMIRKRTCYP
ncbi:unnamed protein product [Bursaphelenchus okinawaensis]|uniref:Uncharacterized protein n=1 Tax=Bursaphelenchus okinawaensis TaxID=465554 RepID=A0A811LAH3_9BILA|nr:unnamed protein product [Bursaphelenchus okinawaensis]CAG9120100.1 unnamed protein product [Bursaphelenchus okinawaensis]